MNDSEARNPLMDQVRCLNSAFAAHRLGNKKLMTRVRGPQWCYLLTQDAGINLTPRGLGEKDTLVIDNYPNCLANDNDAFTNRKEFFISIAEKNDVPSYL